MRSCDEVVRLVVQGEGALVGEELMLSLHAAESEDAGQLQLSNQVAIIFAQFLPL